MGRAFMDRRGHYRASAVENDTSGMSFASTGKPDPSHQTMLLLPTSQRLCSQIFAPAATLRSMSQNWHRLHLASSGFVFATTGLANLLRPISAS